MPGIRDAVVRRFHGRASCMARLDGEDSVPSGSVGAERRSNRVFDIAHAGSGQGVLFGHLSVGRVSGRGGPSGPGAQEDALHVFQAEKLAALRCAGMGHRTKRILRIERKEYQTY